jgi:hypothetical protein
MHGLTNIVRILIENCSYKGDSFIKQKVFHLSSLSHAYIVIYIDTGSWDYDVFFPYHRKVLRLVGRVVIDFSFHLIFDS